MSDIRGKKVEFYNQVHEECRVQLTAELKATAALLVEQFKNAQVKPHALALDAVKTISRKSVFGFAVFETMPEPEVVNVPIRRMRGWVLYQLEADDMQNEILVLTRAGRLIHIVGSEPELGSRRGYTASDDVEDICTLFDDTKLLYWAMDSAEGVAAVHDSVKEHILPNVTLAFEYPQA